MGVTNGGCGQWACRAHLDSLLIRRNVGFYGLVFLGGCFHCLEVEAKVVLRGEERVRGGKERRQGEEEREGKEERRKR